MLRMYIQAVNAKCQSHQCLASVNNAVIMHTGKQTSQLKCLDWNYIRRHLFTLLVFDLLPAPPRASRPPATSKKTYGFSSGAS